MGDFMTNRILAALMAGVSTFATSAVAEDFTVQPAISKVVVYQGGGATVTRKGSINLPAGRHSITAEKLTSALNEDELTVGFSSNNVRLYSMDVDTTYSVTPASDRQAALKEKLDTLADKDTALAASEQAKNMQLAFLRTLNEDANKSDERLPFSDWQNALSFIGDQSAKVLTDIEAVRKERKAIKDQVQAVRRELADTGPKRQDYKEATFEVMTQSAQTLEYEISYFVHGARWSLDVEGALNTDTKRLTLLSKANVSQNTGEDWTNVMLALSNNAPSRELGAINQYPRILSLVDPEEQKRARLEARREPAPAQSGYAESDNFEEIIVTGNRRMNRPRPVRSSSTTFDRMYEVADPVSIASTGEDEFVDLSEANSDVTLVARANPSANRTAYLFVDTELKDFESLRGVTPSLRRDGHYVGTGVWPNLEANTKLELPYGADNAISIDYTEQAPEDGDSGLFGSKKVEEKRYVISVTNNHTSPMTVEIFDQIPVSGHEDIKVKTLSGATEPTEVDMDDKQGLMMWRKTMAPGEVWKINHSYRVTYPSDMLLVGRQ